MSDLALRTALSPGEQEVLACFAQRVAAEAPEVEAIWLYGSKARGDDNEDSDVDLLALTHGEPEAERRRLLPLLWSAEDAVGARGRNLYSLHVWRLDRLADRRAIESFFVAEVDRDKVAIYGSTEL